MPFHVISARRWTYWVDQLPKENKDEIFKLIFSSTDGLGLNIARYVIPGERERERKRKTGGEKEREREERA